MKRTLLALALLVPAIASAAVKVDINVDHHNDRNAEASFEFGEVGTSHVVTPDGCEANVTMELVQESEDDATFTVTVEHNGETKCESEVALTYGESHEFSCEKAPIDGSVTMTASQV